MTRVADIWPNLRVLLGGGVPAEPRITHVSAFARSYPSVKGPPHDEFLLNYDAP